MKEGDRLRAENETLRVRLASLTEATLRISEELDLGAVLQEVADSARSLTDARYSAIITLDDAEELQDLRISGLTPEEKQVMMEFPEPVALFKYLTGIQEPLRTRDFVAHIKSLGFPEFHPPIGAFLGAPIRARDKHVGNIYLAEMKGGRDFTREDEETLEMFAAQAAMAITNARRYGDEQRAKADLEALVNTSPVGVLVFDARTREVVKFNQEARRIVGATDGPPRACEQLLKSMTFRRLDGQEIPRAELPLERAIRSGETIRAEEIVIHLPDGETVSTLINTTPIYAEDGKIVSVVATIQDITPLEEVERLRAEFLGMVSHELRTPLTSIKGSAANALGALSPLDPAEMRQFFRIIEEQADNMRDLINNLLDLTRIEAGTLSVVPESTDVAAVIEQARNVFLGNGYRNVVEVDLVPNLPRIEADRQRVAQVLYNLLTNAAKYSREWSAIRMTAAPKDPYVVFSVTDEGRGIAAEHLPRLFSKFSRIDGDGDRQIGGYGLGLAICKGIVEAHGGRIWAESDGPGHGTRFTFTVPVADEAGRIAATDNVPDVTVAGQEPAEGERVLVIDDDPQILRYVLNTLSEAGYMPIVTGDPDEVAHLLEVEQPHLVLLNLVFPGTDGFELIKRIPDLLAVPVIILSGRGRGQDIAKAFEMGAADYIVKPFSPAEMVARIRAALDKRAMYAQSKALEPYLVGDLKINYVERSVTVAGDPVRLTPTEYKLLYELSTNAGSAVTHDQLLERVWGQGHPGDQRLLRSFVKSLRHKLGDDARRPSYIFTESSVGYRLATP